MFNDRLSLTGRFSLLANFGNLEVGLGAGLDYALTDRWGVGGGLSARYLPRFHTGSPLMVTVPLRLTFVPWVRNEAEVGRRGVLLGLELAGGVTILYRETRGTPPPTPAPSLSGFLTVSYARW